MEDTKTLDSVADQIRQFVGAPTLMKSLAVLLVSIFIAYIVSRVVARILIFIAQKIAVRSDRAEAEKAVQLRRVETYLSVTTAIVKITVIITLGYILWRVFSPDIQGKSSFAAVGAGTVFAVLAGATIVPLLRDITAGATMIIERWFNVGDFIRIEPFGEVSGVVERMSLRSTSIRNLNGELIWIHNQHIQGVRVTPRGLRTIEVDVFVRDHEKGRELIDRVRNTIPSGTMTVVHKIAIVKEEKWSETLWLFTVQGKTPPGREWLVEKYFVESLQELDEASDKKVLARLPIVRYADAAAERSFKRAVRAR